MKLYLIFFIIFVFMFGGLFLERPLYSASDEEAATESVTKKKKKRRRKLGRRKTGPTKKRKKKIKKKKRRKKKIIRRRRMEPARKIRYQQGFYGVMGLKYFMPSSVDFTDVIEAGGSSKYTNAELTHTGGVGFEVGVGYRWIEYLSFEFDVFLVYPMIGSEVAVERDEYGAAATAKAAGAKVIMPRIMAKGIYPISNFELEISAGLGYTQLLKSVDPAEEGVSMAGISYHGSAGCLYKLDRQWSIGGNFEYAMINYSYVDVWDTTMYDSESGKSVSVSQTMMIFGVTANYVF